MNGLVICDFDGTLVDSAALALACANQALAGIGRPPIARDQLATLRAQPFTSVLRTLDIPLWRVPGLALQVRRRMRERSDEIVPVPGIVEALSGLVAAGARLAVVTNNDPATVCTVLERHRFPPVGEIRGGDPVAGKSAALRAVHRRHPGPAVYLSDEARDATACASAQIPMIAVSWGINDRRLLEGSGAAAVIDRPDELAAAVGGIMGGMAGHTGM